MIQTRQIGSLTEIYTDGGGYLTEAYPTNFHTFHTRKLLKNNSSVNMYKPVSEQERQTIEAADAAWVEPPQWFIDQWNALCDWASKYNAKTGYFELEGLKDITYEQAMEIVRCSTPDIAAYTRDSVPIRTLIYQQNGYYGAHALNFPRQTDDVVICSSCSRLEVLRLAHDSGEFHAIGKSRIVNNCTALHTIRGIINAEKVTVERWGPFSNCPKLANFKLTGLKTSLSIPSQAEVSAESLQYLIDNAANTAAITVTVHPDVWGKMLSKDTQWSKAKSCTKDEFIKRGNNTAGEGWHEWIEDASIAVGDVVAILHTITDTGETGYVFARVGSIESEIGKPGKYLHCKAVGYAIGADGAEAYRGLVAAAAAKNISFAEGVPTA